MLERIEFDELETRALRSAARWMFAAGVANVAWGLLGLDTDAESLIQAAALLLVGTTVLVAAWAVRTMARTDGRDQALLGRALRSLRVALAVRLGLVTLMALAITLAPLLFGTMVIWNRLQW
ncbi:MAG: hypothetical protein AB1Z98_38645 [Nannocystaceae bacterium]